MAEKKSDLIDTKTAAAELGVSPRRVQQFVRDGRLPARVLGGVFLIRRGDLVKVGDRKPGRPWPKSKSRPSGR